MTKYNVRFRVSSTNEIGVASFSSMIERTIFVLVIEGCGWGVPLFEWLS